MSQCSRRNTETKLCPSISMFPEVKILMWHWVQSQCCFHRRDAEQDHKGHQGQSDQGQWLIDDEIGDRDYDDDDDLKLLTVTLSKDG